MSESERQAQQGRLIGLHQQLHQETFDTARWLGHRVFHVDGSSFSMPDTPELQAHFGQSSKQKPGCGFPTAHWLVLLHAGTGMITKMLAAPLRTHDMSKIVELHPELQAGDLLVADRGFCSYAHLALLLQRGTHGLLRIYPLQSKTVDPWISWRTSFGHHDRRIWPCDTKPSIARSENPKEILLLARFGSG